MTPGDETCHFPTPDFVSWFRSLPFRHKLFVTWIQTWCHRLPWEPTTFIFGVFIHILGCKTFIFHGFGVQGWLVVHLDGLVVRVSRPVEKVMMLQKSREKTTWDVGKLVVNSGIKHKLYLWTGAGFLPSTVSAQGEMMRYSREFVLNVRDPQWSTNSNFWTLNFQDHDVTFPIHAIHGLGSKRRFLVSICSMFVKCLGCISTSSTLSTIQSEMILSRIVVQINETFFFQRYPAQLIRC